MTEPAVIFKVVVAWPRRMTIGMKYAIDVHLELKSEWPYTSDSYQIGTMLSSRSADGWSLSIPFYSTSTTSMTLHRDGSCTSVHYVAEPDVIGEHELALSLITQGGVPLAQYLLSTVVESSLTPTEASRLM